MKINKQVDAKEIQMCLKVSDMFSANLVDEAGNEIGAYDGYVPDFIPGEWGDYVTLNIDIETGTITNWKKPTATQLEKTFLNKE